MKRYVLGLLVSMILLCLCGLCSCGCQHEWGTNETVRNATCQQTGLLRQTCTLCGEVEETVLPQRRHSYENVVTKEPTCSAQGEQILTCTMCGGTNGTPTPVGKTPHDVEVTVLQAATCRQPGLHHRVCRVCEADLGQQMVSALSHEEMEHTYDGNATLTTDGTETLVCPTCGEIHTRTVEGTAAAMAPFAGLNVSVLGDSISTFQNVSHGTASATTNSTIRDNLLWGGYAPGSFVGVDTPEKTWWGLTMERMGANLLVNNSVSGLSVTNALKQNCMQLHDNTGDNAGTTPDIIFVFLGTNDFTQRGANIGSSSSLTDDRLLQVAADNTYTPSSVAEAYAVLAARLHLTYPDAEIYFLNVLERPFASRPEGHNAEKLAAFNAELRRAVLRTSGVHYVDIATETVIRDNEDFTLYVPTGPTQNNTLHPGALGMQEMARVLQTALLRESRYVTSDVLRGE